MSHLLIATGCFALLLMGCTSAKPDEPDPAPATAQADTARPKMPLPAPAPAPRTARVTLTVAGCTPEAEAHRCRITVQQIHAYGMGTPLLSTTTETEVLVRDAALGRNAALFLNAQGPVEATLRSLEPRKADQNAPAWAVVNVHPAE